MSTITPHIVVQGAARAAEWYSTVFEAEERGRLGVPGGKLMQPELPLATQRSCSPTSFPTWASSRR